MEDFNQELQKLREITNKLAENGYLVDRTAQWEFAFDAVPDLVVIVNPQFIIKFVNKAFAERLETDRVDLLNVPCFNVVYDVNDDDGNVCFTFNSSDERVEIPKLHIRSLGGWFDFTRTPIFDEEKSILGYVCILRDITERLHAEKALREKEVFIKAVLDNLPIGIAVNSVDPAVKFEYMNDNFPRFYRTTREALAESDAFWEAVYKEPEFREAIKKRVLDDCASGNPKRMYWKDVPITNDNDNISFITARNIPIPDKRLMISTVWGVTDIKEKDE